MIEKHSYNPTVLYLDNGSYGLVYRVKRKYDGQIFALKKIEQIKGDQFASVIFEATLMYYLNKEELI